MQGEFLLNFNGPMLWMQRTIDVGSWLAVLMAAGLLYEGHTLEQTRELVATNVELESEIGHRREAEEKTYSAEYEGRIQYGVSSHYSGPLARLTNRQGWSGLTARLKACRPDQMSLHRQFPGAQTVIQARCSLLPVAPG